MSNLTKSLLTAAVVGALALPGLASAAKLGYPAGKQITFAKDLLVDDGTTITTPSDLTLAATADDATRIATVKGDAVTVKVTLTDYAKFDSTADATTLVEGFLVGAQLGGDGAPIGVDGLVGTPYYSAAGQELNFTFTAPGAGTVTGDFAIKLNSMQITSLIEGLYLKGRVGAQITVQNAVGQQILAAKSDLALSEWGLDITSDLESSSTPNMTIDVAGGGTGATAFAPKTRFSPNGAVGGAAADPTGNTLFNAGAIVIDVTKAKTTGGGNETYINNYNAVADNPQYNVVATAAFSIDVKGSDLSAFAPMGGGSANVFLSSESECTGGTSLAGSVTGGTASFKADASSPLFASVTDASPGPSTLYVCFKATKQEMTAQDLTAEVSVDYQLSTQRRNPAPVSVDLLPLRLNGTTVVFQNVNPAGNATAQSFLRVTNNNADACPIVIDAKDDAGRHSGELKYTLAAHESKQLTSEVLENGGNGTTGGFGDGTGKWYVRVTAECNNVKASALNRHQDGVVTDLTPEKGYGNEWLTPSTSL